MLNVVSFLIKVSFLSCYGVWGSASQNLRKSGAGVGRRPDKRDAGIRGITDSASLVPPQTAAFTRSVALPFPPANASLVCGRSPVERINPTQGTPSRFRPNEPQIGRSTLPREFPRLRRKSHANRLTGGSFARVPMQRTKNARMQDCKVFMCLHPYILPPAVASTTAFLASRK